MTLAGGAPFTSANLLVSWRTVSAGPVGTSQAAPKARSSVATVASAAAQSRIEVQLCGTSSGAGEYARWPASSGFPRP